MVFFLCQEPACLGLHDHSDTSRIMEVMLAVQLVLYKHSAVYLQQRT